MVRVLAIRAQLVDDLAGLDELLAGALVDEAGDPAAARRIDRQGKGVVLDGQRVDRPPAGVAERRRARHGHGVEGPVADGGHVTREERDRRPGRPARLATIGRLEQERHTPAGIVAQLEPEGGVVGQVDLDPGDVRPRPRQCIEDSDRLAVPGGVDLGGEVIDRAVQDGRPELERLAPATDQVEVDLVRFGAGDPVVMGPEEQLPPRLVDRLGREPGARQRGDRGELLRAEQRVLGDPLHLLGVDERDVLARVDRVHVARLRGERAARRGLRRTHGVEVFARDRHGELRPDVAAVPVALDRGDPFVRRGVVRADGQHHVLRRRKRGKFGEQAVDLGLGCLERGGGIHPPACRIVVGHEAREQRPPTGRDPVELHRKLHPRHLAGRQLGEGDAARTADPVGTPLVERTTRP